MKSMSLSIYFWAELYIHRFMLQTFLKTDRCTWCCFWKCSGSNDHLWNQMAYMYIYIYCTYTSILIVLCRVLSIATISRYHYPASSTDPFPPPWMQHSELSNNKVLLTWTGTRAHKLAAKPWVYHLQQFDSGDTLQTIFSRAAVKAWEATGDRCEC